jgi:hypothetical protein
MSAGINDPALLISVIPDIPIPNISLLFKKEMRFLMFNNTTF